MADARRGPRIALSRQSDDLVDERARLAARPMTARPSVVYVVPDKMGGMMNIIANLLEYRVPDGLSHHVILTHNQLDVDTRFDRRLAADTQTAVEYALPIENLHAVMRRLAQAVPPGPGVYVAGDLLDLATASVHDFGRAVIYMLHGDSEYYYDLAVRHDDVVHGFIAYSRRMYEQLLARLPHRADTIFHLSYGVPLPTTVRHPSDGPLRLVYGGRLEHRQKGIFELPEIDRLLSEQGVRARWTVAGAGPDEEELKRRWAFNPHVRWLGGLSSAELQATYAEQDVFVLPTRVEGFPVALVEAMGAGLVPVVSAIKSGVPEIVAPGITGECPGVGDVPAFAQAIAGLDRDRPRLEAISAAARTTVVERFDIRARVTGYQALYARWRELYRPLAAGRHLQYGSRLDQAWLPNAAVYAIRRGQRWLREKRP
jgi:glycosyltransferase involved in cell wall biosynthesis